MCIFMVLWSLLVYSPVAHWVWSTTGWVAGLGAIDFAGGTVVHINAGVAGLMCALVMGKRVGLGRDDMHPFNISYVMIGASLLWVGWFGFNAGSAVGSNGRAGMAMTVTQIATAAAALGWMFAEWIAKGKPTLLGICSGAVAGLVAITPASGFVLPGASIIIGLVAGVVCFWTATYMKNLIGYDDSLDCFGVHGIGGIIGALLTGVLAYGPLSATASNPTGVVGGLHQLMVQAEAVCVTIVWSGRHLVRAAQGDRPGDRPARDRGAGDGRAGYHPARRAPDLACPRTSTGKPTNRAAPAGAAFFVRGRVAFFVLAQPVMVYTAQTD